MSTEIQSLNNCLNSWCFTFLFFYLGFVVGLRIANSDYCALVCDLFKLFNKLNAFPSFASTYFARRPALICSTWSSGNQSECAIAAAYRSRVNLQAPPDSDVPPPLRARLSQSLYHRRRPLLQLNAARWFLRKKSILNFNSTALTITTFPWK